MNNDLIDQKNWWQQNWKWCLPLVGFVVISFGLVVFSGLSGYMSHFAKAYVDTELLENAIQKAQKDQRVQELIGEIAPIDSFAILEGEARYSKDNSSVDVSVRVKGSKRKAILDITANRINGNWKYKKINIRIKKPIEEKQTIEVIR